VTRVSSAGAATVGKNRVAFCSRLRQAETLMTLDTREPARPILAWLYDAPDLLVILVWAALIFCAAILRVNFIGDGVRHLTPIVTNSPPSLGEPRWLLFPIFVFAIIKPVQMAGLVHSAKDAARVFLALDCFAGLAYLLLLRQWLICRSISLRSRVVALLLAGVTVPMLHYSSDIVEVIVPATVALAGLVYLASQPPKDASKGLYVAATAIAIATLLYQGIILGVALVPCAIARDARVRLRAIILSCAILGVAPLVMLTTLTATGNRPATAIHLMLTGEENTLFRSLLASHRLPLWERPIAAISFGVASSIIQLPDNLGLRQGLRLLLHSTTFMAGALNILGRLLALVIVAAGAAVIVRRRDWRIGIAFAGLLILPILRGYAYLKYYALMPIVIALVASVSPPAIVLGAGGVVAAFNLTYLARDIGRDRQLAHDIAPLFASANSSACWLTTGWGPPIFGWPGSICSMSQVLAAADTDQVDAMITENNRTLKESFRRCFCESSAVYTDDLTLALQERAAGLANHYRFAGADLNELLWNPNRGAIAFERDGIVTYTYSRPVQSEICDKLTTSRKTSH
jgi:hypothetical protein